MKKRLPVLESRLLCLVQRADLYRSHLWNTTNIRGELAAAQFFEEAINAIHRPTFTAAGNCQMIASRLQHETFRAEIIPVDS